MSSPASCLRCSRLSLVTPSGLCITCAANEDTTGPSFRPEPLSRPEPATASFLVPEEPSTAPAPDPADRPLPPAPPGYDLLVRLGGGGMGEVYLAREQTSERPVAMKFLRNPGDPAALERFVIELRVLAKLDHPGIVRVYASDFLRSDPYFTMEFVPGGSLARTPDAGRSVDDAVGLVRTVAAAVAAAHGANVIHRDLKPSNILLGLDGTPKIADFGLAKRLDESDPLTVASGALGTPGYMPPEQVSRKNGEIGAWSDVYGLGATLYHTLVGRAPFVGDSVADTITKVLADPPERVRAQRPEVPLALEGIVMKCLEKDPKDRYQTVDELLADLDRYKAGRKPVAPLLTPARRLARWARRNRGRLAGVGAALLLAVCALWAGAAMAPAPIPVPTPKPPDPLVEIETALAEGRAVELVGRSDPPRPPRWWEWSAGGSELVPSDCWRGAISFDTNRTSAMTLARDPVADRYRLEVEIGHEKRGRNVTGVGVFVGHERHVGRDGTVVDRYLCVDYSDYWSELEEDVPATRADHAVTIREVLVIRPTDERGAFTRSSDVASLPFVPVNKPGNARRIAVAVTPNGITFSWHDGAKWVPISTLSAAVLDDRRRLLHAELDSVVPNAGITLAGWTPRRPLGVYASTAAVAIRSVTLTPETP